MPSLAEKLPDVLAHLDREGELCPMRENTFTRLTCPDSHIRALRCLSVDDHCRQLNPTSLDATV